MIKFERSELQWATYSATLEPEDLDDFKSWIKNCLGEKANNLLDLTYEEWEAMVAGNKREYKIIIRNAKGEPLYEEYAIEVLEDYLRDLAFEYGVDDYEFADYDTDERLEVE